MAVGKSISKSAALYGEMGGKAPEIAMPPLDETPPIAQATQQWDQQPSNQQPSSPFSVPDQVPAEVYNQMVDQTEVQDQEVDSEQEQQEEEQQVAVQAKPTGQSNFKLIREAKEKAERERDALLAQMLEMQSYMQQQRQTQVSEKQEPVEQDFDFNIDEDALVEGKYVKKVVHEIKKLKNQLKEHQNQTTQTSMEAKIKASYPDFERVVSKENVEMLNAQFPDIAASLRDTQDLYSKASSAYSIIKKFGIYKDPVADTYQNDRVKAVVNAQKPRPLASVNPQQGDSPLSKANAFANGMTPELKKQLYAEMMAAKKSI